MKTQILIFGIVFLLLMKSYFIISSHPITRFIVDERPKCLERFDINNDVVFIQITKIYNTTDKDYIISKRYTMTVFFFWVDYSLCTGFHLEDIPTKEI